MITVTRFTAPWCGPCEKFGPALERSLEEFPVDLQVVDIDIDPDAIVKHEIRSVPTTVVYQDGEEIGRFVGAGLKASIVRAVEAALTT